MFYGYEILTYIAVDIRPKNCSAAFREFRVLFRSAADIPTVIVLGIPKQELTLT